MQLSFTNIINFIATYFFDGSITLAGLAILVIAWAICAIILMNMKASPAFSVVPMIPLAIFFSAYGILNETLMVFVVLVSAALVASEMKKVVN